MSGADRREFLQGSLAAASAGVFSGAGAVAVAGSVDERVVTIGLIGCGGMGGNHLSLLSQRKDVRLAWVCDVDAQRLAAAAKTVEMNSGTAPQTTDDMRRVLDDKAVDAVFIATPDHWHAPAAILALSAGKHVYVEKPCCHNIREGRLLAEAVQRSGKKLQVGTQSRSTEFVQTGIERIRRGDIGEILVAKAWNSQRRGTIGKQQPSDPPKNLDYDLWLGPVTYRPYQSNFLHGIWRWWYDFGCGDIGNDGVHDIDVARFGKVADRFRTRFEIAVLAQNAQAALLQAMNERFEFAAMGIFAAMVLDGLDGRVARMTRTQSDFGAELDSLSDMVSFGVAPALVVYTWALRDFAFSKTVPVLGPWLSTKLGWIAAFIYCACAALRLARFNTNIDIVDKRYFQGLPSPAAACVLAGLVWAVNEYEIKGVDVKWLAWGLTVFTGLTMVSNVKFYSGKDINLRRSVPFSALVGIAMGVGALFVFASTLPELLFAVFLLYLISGYVLWAWEKLKKSSAPPPP